jgi:hypothetical protein
MTVDDDDVLFECDFSVDELAVLADLLEIPALPGVDPDMIVPDEAKGAAARGLLARGVVVADGAKGTVEITQPYATMIASVLFATSVHVADDGQLQFEGATSSIAITRSSSQILTWRVGGRPGLRSEATATIDRGQMRVATGGSS